MMEQSSLRFDVGPANQLVPKFQAICEDVLRAQTSHFDKDDRQFVQAGDLPKSAGSVPTSESTLYSSAGSEISRYQFDRLLVLGHLQLFSPLTGRA